MPNFRYKCVRLKFYCICSSGYFYTGGGGVGEQWLDDVECTGQEVDIAQCMTKNWGVTDCTHHEDVWVACCKYAINIYSFDSHLQPILFVWIEIINHHQIDRLDDLITFYLPCNANRKHVSILTPEPLVFIYTAMLAPSSYANTTFDDMTLAHWLFSKKEYNMHIQQTGLIII